MKLLNYTSEEKENLYKIGIYKISFKNDKKNRVYIGSALIHKNRKNHRGFYHRWIRHLEDLTANKHANCKLQNACNKYGIENINFEIIEILEKDLNKNVYEDIETEYISKFNAVDEGFNILRIAYTSLGVKRSEETKLKNSIAKSKSLIYQYNNEGKFVTSFRSVKEVSLTYNHINTKTLVKILNKKLPTYKENYWFREFKGDNINIELFYTKKTNDKPIYQYDLEGNFIREWTSFKQIRDILKIETSNIYAVLRQDRKIAFNSYWDYELKDNKNIIKPKHSYFLNRPFKECKKRQKKVNCFDLEGNFIKTYDSITKAKDATGAKNILAVLKGKRLSSGNLKWALA